MSEKMTIPADFRRDLRTARVVLDWWTCFYPADWHLANEPTSSAKTLSLTVTPTGQDPKPADRARRAELRRCNDLSAVVMSAAYHHLRVRWIAAGLEDPAGWPEREDRLATLARVLIEVTAHDPIKLGVAMACPAEGSERSRVAEVRLKRLLDAVHRGELLNELLRIVALLDGRANLLGLADLAYYLQSPQGGNRLRRELANDYYLTLIQSDSTTNH